MRIINAVLGDATGGRWQVVRRYADTLSACGHEPVLLYNSRHRPDDGLDQAPYRTLALRNSGHYDLLATLHAARLVNEFQPSLVIAHCSRSLAVFQRIPRRPFRLLAVNHSNKVRRSLTADGFINISRHIDELITSAGVTGKPYFYLPNCVDLPESPDPHRPLHTPVRIGAFARFDQVKGLDIFIRALGRLKQSGVDFRAVLGGDGPEGSGLALLARQLGLQSDLRLTGWVNDRQAFFHGIDIFCVPARADAFGLTPLEAAAATLALVLSDAHGHREMFQDGQQALFFPRGDDAALATALRSCIDNPASAHARARAAHERVRAQFSCEQFRSKLCAIVKKAAGESR